VPDDVPADDGMGAQSSSLRLRTRIDPADGPSDAEYCDAPRDLPVPVDQKTSNLGGGGSFFPKTKSALIAEFGEYKAPVLACARRLDRSRASIGGEYVKVDLTEGDRRYLLGSFGAGPCVGLLVIGPIRDGKRTSYSFHFTATDDAYNTLKRTAIEGPAMAVMFGGDASGPSNATADGVARYLRERAAGDSTQKFTVLGYSDTEGLWIDYDGNVRRYRLDRASQNER
jgi:hypothetical protein